MKLQDYIKYVLTQSIFADRTMVTVNLTEDGFVTDKFTGNTVTFTFTNTK